jgi:pyruvate dehydrogenase E1 component alpha subunit|tara:strand:+ start:7929 stop:8891 length:963 start_codon:yes stop_codon:yes gene_type:complete
MKKEELLKVYRTMKTIRSFEERCDKEFMQGNIPGFVHLYAGQEAVAVGICSHLSDEDKIGSTHRGHGHCIAKGCDVKGMMHEIMGKADGLCKGKGGSMHIADLSKGMLGANAIVGGAPPTAVGAALTAKTLGNKTVAIAFSGDGASNQGTTFEAMNMAVVLQVPAIFVFENNGYGEHTGADYAVGSKDIAGRAEGFGLPTYKVDGTDFFDVYETAGKAIKDAREGKGPSVIEAEAVRFGGHFIGDPQNYRAEGELDKLREEKDCLKIFRAKVVTDFDIKEEELDGIDKEVETLIDETAKSGISAPMPDAKELNSDVYLNY